jgi:hypothetical protein
MTYETKMHSADDTNVIKVSFVISTNSEHTQIAKDDLFDSLSWERDRGTDV